MDSPVDLAWRDGDAGLYVVEQGGTDRPRSATGDPTTVLDVTDLTEADGERGLLGLAFAPAATSPTSTTPTTTATRSIAEYPVGRRRHVRHRRRRPGSCS